MSETNNTTPPAESTTSSETLLEFPTEFAVKAFGKKAPDFPDHVRALIAEHVPNLLADSVRERPSSKQKFMAVTITFTATSKAQLDAIYQSLSDDSRVLMAL